MRFAAVGRWCIVALALLALGAGGAAAQGLTPDVPGGPDQPPVLPDDPPPSRPSNPTPSNPTPSTPAPSNPRPTDPSAGQTDEPTPEELAAQKAQEQREAQAKRRAEAIARAKRIKAAKIAAAKARREARQARVAASAEVAAAAPLVVQASAAVSTKASIAAVVPDAPEPEPAATATVAASEGEGMPSAGWLLLGTALLVGGGGLATRLLWYPDARRTPGRLLAGQAAAHRMEIVIAVVALAICMVAVLVIVQPSLFSH